MKPRPILTVQDVADAVDHLRKLAWMTGAAARGQHVYIGNEDGARLLGVADFLQIMVLDMHIEKENQ